MLDDRDEMIQADLQPELFVSFPASGFLHHLPIFNTTARKNIVRTIGVNTPDERDSLLQDQNHRAAEPHVPFSTLSLGHLVGVPGTHKSSGRAPAAEEPARFRHAERTVAGDDRLKLVTQRRNALGIQRRRDGRG